jgi:hypothetical protein
MCSRRVVGALLLTFDTVPDAGAITTAIGSAVVTAGAGFAGTGRRASEWTRWSTTFALLGGRGNRKAMRQSGVADNPVQVGGRIGDTELPFDKDTQLLAIPDISLKPA